MLEYTLLLGQLHRSVGDRKGPALPKEAENDTIGGGGMKLKSGSDRDVWAFASVAEICTHRKIVTLHYGRHYPRLC